jgi:hypothetical protein
MYVCGVGGQLVFIVPVSDNTLLYEGVGGIYRPCQ